MIDLDRTLAKGYVATRYQEGFDSAREERLFAVMPDGKVLATEWAPYSDTFGKRDRFHETSLTLEQVLDMDDTMYCGQYCLD